jgi:hypothetical protein
MTKLVLLFVLASGLSACSSFAFAPMSGGARPYQPQPGVAGSEFECMTDDGYGRSRPCNAQD